MQGLEVLQAVVRAFGPPSEGFSLEAERRPGEVTGMKETRQVLPKRVILPKRRTGLKDYLEVPPPEAHHCRANHPGQSASLVHSCQRNCKRNIDANKLRKI